MRNLENRQRDLNEVIHEASRPALDSEDSPAVADGRPCVSIAGNNTAPVVVFGSHARCPVTIVTCTASTVQLDQELERPSGLPATLDVND